MTKIDALAVYNWGYNIPNIVILDDVYPGAIEVKSISVMYYSKMKNISSEISIPMLSEANRACRHSLAGYRQRVETRTYTSWRLPKVKIDRRGQLLIKSQII